MADADFAARVIHWQRRYGRHDLPWQEPQGACRDPYRVWLSEIMLQQTQVATVIPYYRRFLERFPDIAALAAAPLDAVMASWSGLGYYARARNLHRCAQAVMAEHRGEFPRDAAVIANLPGIGRSTANAIAAFCFAARLPILDGNVKRLLCRHDAIDGFPGTAAVEARLWRLAEERLPRHDVDVYLQGQMDLGATVCTRSKPRCTLCPVAATCAALAQDRVEALPVARPRTAVPERSAEVLVLLHRGCVLLEQRPPSGIWGGLLSLPEVRNDESPQAAARRFGCAAREFVPLSSLRHAFTHFRLTLLPQLSRVEPQAAVREPSLVWLTLDAIEDAALPTPIRTILQMVAREETEASHAAPQSRAARLPHA